MFKFTDFGWTELFVLLGMLGTQVLLYFGKISGEIGSAIILGLVGIIATARRVAEGQRLKFESGSTKIETQDGSTPAIPPK